MASIIAHMEPLPALVYTAAQVRAMDRHAIDVAGIPGYALMQRAGGGDAFVDCSGSGRTQKGSPSFAGPATTPATATASRGSPAQRVFR